MADEEDKYPKKLLQNLNNLRNQTQLCDIAINIEGKTFNAHRAVLAASCNYFSAMLTSGFKEQLESEITIDGSAAAFEVLLDFIYSGKVNDVHAMAHAYEVIEMANYMDFTELVNICSNIITSAWYRQPEKMSPEAAYKILLLTRDNPDLHSELNCDCEDYFANSFKELKNLNVFLQDSGGVTFLSDFLQRKDIGSKEDEREILEMVVNWLKYDWDNRRIHAYNLLQKVRLGLVASEHIKTLVGPELLSIPECSDLVNHVLEEQTSSKSKFTLSTENPEMFATRSTVTAPVATLLQIDESVIHKRTEMINVSHFLNRNRWIEMADMTALPMKTSGHSLITVDGDLYALGGVEKTRDFGPELDPDLDTEPYDRFDEDVQRPYDLDREFKNLFFQYDADQNVWHSLAPMKTARSDFLCVYLDGFIYAIGGYNTFYPMIRDVERYNLASKNWELVKSLPEMYHHVSAVAFRGKLLVYGIRKVSETPNTYKHVIMILHPETQNWQSIVVHEAVVRLKRSQLFSYKEQCYIILFTEREMGFPRGFLRDGTSVTTLNIQDNEDDIQVTIGEDINQDGIHNPSGLNIFRIYDEVFEVVNGLVYKTHYTIDPDRNGDVRVKSTFGGHWYNGGEISSNAVWFTFDKNKLLDDEESRYY